MRVDKFTKIIKMNESHFVCNIKMGTVDAIDNCTADELEKLRLVNSFTPLECNFSESLIGEMINRGYITYYSEKEELDERKWFVEKLKDKSKKQEKTLSLFIDDVVGRNWCFQSNSNENIYIDRSGIVKILKDINNQKLARKIDLWLLLIDRKNDWDLIVHNINENKLLINSLYTIIDNDEEIKKISSWMISKVTAPKIINVKYKNSKAEYLTLEKEVNNIIKVKSNLLFINKHPFFCPFLYITFFVDKNFNISYCGKKLLCDKELFENKITFHETEYAKGRGNDISAQVCENPESCIYSIYCNKMCPYLLSLYNDSNNGYCSLIPLFDSLLESKIKSMV